MSLSERGRRMRWWRRFEDRFALTLALIGFLIVTYAFLIRCLGRLIR